MTPVFCDWETASSISLRDVGGRAYARHCSTKVLCATFSWNENQYATWVPDSTCGNLPRYSDDGSEILRGERLPDRIAEAVQRAGVVAAHNAKAFDAHVWNRFVGIPVRWIDTIDLARAAGLPASLDDLGVWFEGRGKDDAKKLLAKCYTLTWSGAAWTNRFIGPGSIAAIVRYCIRDVELLRRVWSETRDFPFHDPGVIELHDAINERGVHFDEELAARIAEVSTKLVSDATAQIHHLAPELRHVKLRSVPAMTKWLQSHGVALKNLRRETVEQFLNDPTQHFSDPSDEYAPAQDSISVPSEVLQILRLRNAALRITASKLERAVAVCENHRLRDLFVYHSAHTGRFSSRLVQVHNLPRGVTGVAPELCDDVTYDTVTAEATRLGVPADDILSSLVRPCLIAAPGHTLVTCDFSGIELRVCGWIAGDDELRQMFIDDVCPYRDMASRMFGVARNEVTKDQRQVAKPVILGGIYGLGPRTLGDYAAKYGVDLDAVGLDAKTVVEQFRDSRPKIAGVRDGEYQGHTIRRGGLWRDVGTAFRNCIETGGTYHAARCAFSRYGSGVLVKLPSGRSICYRKCRLEWEVPSFGGDPRPTIVHTGGRGDVRLWNGLIVENLCQAIARDLLCAAMLRCEFPVVLHVHDEIVCEVPEDSGASALSALILLMSDPPKWAEGLVLAAEGHYGRRYRK